MNPAQAQGLVLLGGGVLIILGGLFFLPSEVLLGPLGAILILGGLAIASKGAGT